MIHCDFLGSNLKQHQQHQSIGALFDADTQLGPSTVKPTGRPVTQPPNFLSKHSGRHTETPSHYAVHYTKVDCNTKAIFNCLLATIATSTPHHFVPNAMQFSKNLSLFSLALLLLVLVSFERFDGFFAHLRSLLVVIGYTYILLRALRIAFLCPEVSFLAYPTF